MFFVLFQMVKSNVTLLLKIGKKKKKKKDLHPMAYID